MKRVKRLLIVAGAVMLAITGCSDNEPLPDIEFQLPYNLASTDYQYYLHEQGRGLGITEVEDGYYMINGSYLYFVDKKNMKPILLDHNPDNDCSPSDPTVEPEKCSAYIQVVDPLNLGSITYYNDHLYLVELNKQTDKATFGVTQYVLVRMDKDGSNRKVLREFHSPPLPVVIHRDQIYYVNNITNGNPTILTVPLADPEQEASVLHTTQSKSIHSGNIIAFGDYLYISESGQNMYRTVKFDLATGESELMYSDYEGNAAITSISQDKLYFGLFTGDPLDERSWDQYSSNLDGTDVVKLPIKLPIVSWLYADDHFRYLNPVSWYSDDEEFSHVAREMVIYDMNDEEVAHIDMSMMAKYGVGVVGNDQHMFFRSNDSAEFHRIYYLDKSQIRSGKKVKLQLLSESAIHF